MLLKRVSVFTSLRQPSIVAKPQQEIALTRSPEFALKRPESNQHSGGPLYSSAHWLAGIRAGDSPFNELGWRVKPDEKAWVPSVDEHTELQTTSSTAGFKSCKRDKKVKRKKITWKKKFALPRQYKKERGDCNPPVNYVTSNVKLGGWAATQR